MGSEHVFFVFATSEPGTLAALRHLAAAEKPARANVVILLPRIVEYGQPLDRPIAPDDIEALAAPYRELAARVGVDAVVRVCATRDPRHVPGRLVLDASRIVVGGRWRSWRSTAEQRLARELASDGHDVTFVDVDSGATHHPDVTHA